MDLIKKECTLTSTEEDIEKFKPSNIAVAVYNGPNSWVLPWKVKLRVNIWSSNFTPRNIAKRTETKFTQKTCTQYSQRYYSYSQKVEIIKMAHQLMSE